MISQPFALYSFRNAFEDREQQTHPDKGKRNRFNVIEQLPKEHDSKNKLQARLYVLHQANRR